MNPNEINQFAQQAIQGQWKYYIKEKMLKRNFSSSKELNEFNLIDHYGYLFSELKTAIRSCLGKKLLTNVTGPFGDDDIFCGDIDDGVTYYAIELHNITEETMDELSQNHNITIKIIDNE